MALGNVVGSNIFNLLLILGAASLVRPLDAPLRPMSFDLLALGALTLLCVAGLCRPRVVTRLEGALMSTCYAGFVVSLAL
jgi:cation:H+ antiporter